MIEMAGVEQWQLDAVLADERLELTRRETLYRGSRPLAGIEGHVVIVVDDGIATGATVRAALMALRSSKPARTVVATPVAPSEAQARLSGVVDAFVCTLTPTDFYAVGQFYKNFDQTRDEEVRELLLQSQKNTV